MVWGTFFPTFARGCKCLVRWFGALFSTFALGNCILYFKMPLPHIVPLKELDRFGQSWTYFMFQDSEVGTRCGNPVINFYMLLQSLCQCTMVKHIQLQSKEISIIKTLHTKNKNVTVTKSSKRVEIFLGKKWDWVRHAKFPTFPQIHFDGSTMQIGNLVS